MAKPLHPRRQACLITAIVLTLCMAPGQTGAQGLSKDDQKCVNEVNKNLEKVGKAVLSGRVSFGHSSAKGGNKWTS